MWTGGAQSLSNPNRSYRVHPQHHRLTKLLSGSSPTTKQSAARGATPAPGSRNTGTNTAESAFSIRVQVDDGVSGWIEVFYSRYRRYSVIGYISPVAYELTTQPTNNGTQIRSTNHPGLAVKPKCYREEER